MRKLKLFLSLLMLITFSVGTVWATTYKLTKVTSVSAGNKYVFEQNSHVFNNTCASSALQTTATYSTAGLAGTESYVWTLETATGGFYIKNVSLASNQYLNNASKTTVSLGSASSVWNITFTDGVALITNKSNSDRFLGDTGTKPAANNVYKAYATTNIDDHLHDITVYVLEEEASCSNTVTITKGAETNGTYSLSATSLCGDGDGGEVTVSAITPASGYEFDEITTSASGVVDNTNKKVTGIKANTTITVKFKELPRYTVSFSTGAGNPAQADIPETTAGAGITLPDGPTPTCSSDGWAFAGWAEAAVASETTTAPTLLNAGANYKPASNCTLYAVYSRTEGASAVYGNTTINTDISGVTGSYADGTNKGDYKWSFTQLMKGSSSMQGNSSKSSILWNTVAFPAAISKVELVVGAAAGASNTAGLGFATSVKPTDVSVSLGNGTDYSLTETGTLTITSGIPANSTYLSLIWTSGASYYSSVKVYWGNAGTTYYLSAPTCCTKHTITVDDAVEFGSIEADLAEACEGTVVTLTATPDENCQFVSWSVNSGAVTVTDNQFSMPDGNVTVTATFAEIKNTVTITTPEGGTLSVLNGETPVATSTSIKKGTALTVTATPNAENHYIGGVITVKDGEEKDVTASVLSGSTLTMPGYAITISASFTPTYKINLVAEGGSIALDYTAGGAAEGYAIAGTEIMATATADGAHTFSSLALSKNITVKEIDDNVATFTMPAEAVTITATFAEKAEPTIGVSTSSIVFDAVDYKGALAAEVFTVSGVALAAGQLTIACNNDAFEVSPKAINVDGTLAETDVTVTPKTTSCGTFNGTITISGGSAAPVNVSVKLTVNKLANGLAWKKGDDVATEATVTINADDNVFPTLYNSLGLEGIEYSSYDDEVASINVSTGAIELKKAGLTYIVANFAGNDTVAALAEDALSYALTVQKKYTAKWYVNGTPVDEQTDLAGTSLKTFPSDFSSFTDCSELEFQGWLTAPLGEASASKPAGLITETEGLQMPAEDVNYYAVFATAQTGDPVKVTDNIDNAFTGVSGNSYVDWSGKAGTSSAVYAGNSAGDYTTVQLRSKNSNSGVVTTATGSGKLSKVTITWNDNTSAARIVDIYGKTTAYEAATDLYASATQGTKLGSLNIDDATDGVSTLVVEGDYTCVGIRSNNSALYLDNIAIEWTTPGTTTYKDYVTTCPSCTKVELNAVAVEHGSIALSSTLVKTCDLAKVTVTPDPATGYELTNVALSGVAGATYADGEISIPAEASGTLDVTATFSAINYTVTMEQTGGASATLTGATDEAHYNGTINITAEDKDGYIFNGWTSDPVVTFEHNEALETSFSMPNSDVTITASYTKILTVAEAVTLVTADKSATHADSYVSGLISKVESYNSTYNSITYWVSDNGQTEALQIYGGRGLNGANFSSKDDLHVGDKVVVNGKLMWYGEEATGKCEVDKDNILYSYEAINATPTSIAISGTPDVTKYAEGQIFNPKGLVVTATYNTGYQADVTSEVKWSNDLTDGKVMADGSVKVTAKLGEVVSAAYDVEVELAEQAPTFSVAAGRYTSAQSVELSAADGAKIYYTTDGTEPTKESALYSTAIELNERKVYTIKAFASGVKGESQIVSAEYNINLPYTFAELVAADLPSGSEDIVVTVDNNISEIPTSTTYGVFVDQKDKTGTKDVEIYFNNHAIPSSWKVGGHLSGTVTGTWTLYKGATSSIWEIVPESSFEWTNLSYTKPKAPISWPSATASVYTAGKSNTWQKLNNEAGVSVTYSCDDAGAVTIDPSTGFITIVKAGVTVITASTDGNDDYSANVAEYTLTVVGPKSLTIEGSLVNDKYEAGQSFNRTGLSATVTYTDDETSDVTSAAEWSFDPATITEDADVTVTATWNAMNANKVVAVYVNKHTVSFTAAPANGTVVVATDAKGLSPIATGDEFVKGTVLYVIATPDASFKVNERLAISGGSSDILVKDGDDYKFTVGTEDVEVIVSFTASGTALDNTEASEKVVKTMENGVLIIRRGDKTYNGQGQLIK